MEWAITAVLSSETEAQSQFMQRCVRVGVQPPVGREGAGRARGGGGGKQVTGTQQCITTESNLLPTQQLQHISIIYVPRLRLQQTPL